MQVSVRVTVLSPVAAIAGVGASGGADTNTAARMMHRGVPIRFISRSRARAYGADHSAADAAHSRYTNTHARPRRHLLVYRLATHVVGGHRAGVPVPHRRGAAHRAIADSTDGALGRFMSSTQPGAPRPPALTTSPSAPLFKLACSALAFLAGANSLRTGALHSASWEGRGSAAERNLCPLG